jgi:proteasome lid subunit RPN8/RPN11
MCVPWPFTYSACGLHGKRRAATGAILRARDAIDHVAARLSPREGFRMRSVTLRRASFDAIVAQAEREFPYECCGFILTGDGVEEVRPIRNIQNEKHAEDPVTFPRDARTAFLMEPREHLAALNEIDRRKLKLAVVYHSHPDHDAYFSPTDRAQACSFDPDEPDYPGTAYVVMSVRGGRFERAAAFVWEPARKEFVETTLELVA